MKRSFVRITGLALGLSLLPAPAAAQGLYVGASVGSADPDLGSLDSDVGGKLFGGYRFSPMFSAEVGYVMLGELDFDDGDIEIDGFELSGVGRLPLTTEWSLFGSVGAFAWDRDVDVVSAEFSSDDDVDFTWSVGAEYSLTDQVGIRAAWQQFLDVEGDIDYLSLGATYGF